MAGLFDPALRGTHGSKYVEWASRQGIMDSIKRIGLLIIGWLFIVLGIIGLFLPILQGILFILIGLAILSSRSKLIKSFLKHLEERHPRYHERVEIWRKKIRNLFGKN